MSNFQNKIIKKEKGIWRYANFYNEFVKQENRLSLGDGSARGIEIEGINKLLDINHLYFKREDENECGSLKDRSLAYQVSLAKQNGEKDLVISTSGNAGIAAAAYCQKAGIKLYIFISPRTEKAKIAEMQKYNPVIIKSKKAIRLTNYLSAKYKIKNLRPSVDDDSIEGFKSIAFEIFENLGEVDALFTFVTSGSSFVGIGRAYKYLLENGEINKLPKLFAAQSGEVCSIAEEFSNFKHPPGPSQEGSISKGAYNHRGENSAGKLGVKNTRRKNEIIDLIKSSGGSGLYITANEISEAKNTLEKNNVYTSLEGCASFAGVLKINKKDRFLLRNLNTGVRNLVSGARNQVSKYAKPNLDKVVCVLSGKLRTLTTEIDTSKIYKAECFEDVDEIVFSI